MSELLKKYKVTYNDIDKVHSSKKDFFLQKFQSMEDLVNKETNLDSEKFQILKEQLQKLYSNTNNEIE